MLEPAKCGRQGVARRSEDEMPTLLDRILCLTWQIRNVKMDSVESHETLNDVGGRSSGQARRDICDVLFLLRLLSVVAAFLSHPVSSRLISCTDVSDSVCRATMTKLSPVLRAAQTHLI
jgi:hypothetical protein